MIASVHDTPYQDSLTVGEGRARYFAANGFGDGGYENRWVKLQAGPIPLYLPNTSARVRSVRLHDVHHVVTGYDTTWTGEAEIGAWEIASSCADHYAAWVLNLLALPIGLLLDPGAIYRAFVRGRQSDNLYRREFSADLLGMRIGELRRRLRLDRARRPPTARDRLSFGLWCAAAVSAAIGIVAVALSPVGLLLALLV